MKSRVLLGILSLAAVLVVAACAAPAAPAQPTAVPEMPTAVPPAPMPTTPPTTGGAGAMPSSAAALMIAKNSALGAFLADDQGRTLYLYTKDTKGTSNCYDQCAQAWPPLVPSGQLKLQDGVSTDLISTTVRKDGAVQVTYNGWPLYYYVKDKASGDSTGQAVGNVWWVVSGEGNPIKPAKVALAQIDPLGKVLVDDAGMTLYLYTKDTPNVTNCYGKCEVAWPPLLTLSQPELGDGVASGLISTTLRKDGTAQVTYNGWPLYYYVKDLAAGDVTGQAVGKVWWVVSGEGNAIKPAALAVTSTEKLGNILVDGDGRALYMYTKDTKDMSNCYDKCEVAWPPLLQTDKPAVGNGVDASLLGATQRKDGTSQVTYNGMPLYYYIKDHAAGDITGQAVGSVWYVLSPDGKIVQ